jgi:hypothetical protein
MGENAEFVGEVCGLSEVGHSFLRRDAVFGGNKYSETHMLNND